MSCSYRYLLISLLIGSVGFAQHDVRDDGDPALLAQPAANLDQVRNGSAAAPNDPGEWVNGNAGNQNAHYVEGLSIPYRVVMTDLPIGQVITLELGYDAKNSGAHAIDFLTHYDRLEPHAAFGHNAETIDPTDGVTGVVDGSAADDTAAIPAPTSVGSPVVGEPTAAFLALPAGERIMSIWNGAFSALDSDGMPTGPISYGPQADLNAAQSEQTIFVSFTATSATAILSWGGHIAEATVWGDGNSAGGISGSPYHMRLKDWNLNNLGNQDRSLSAAAVIGDCNSDDDCDDSDLCTQDLCTDSFCEHPPVDCPRRGTFCDPATGMCVECILDSECDDSNECTTDGCVMGVCENTAVDCDDGLYCNGVETCDPMGGCQAGTPPTCDDGIACTDDSCDEDTDSCVNTPNNGNCDDGLYCNGAETCDATGDCQAGTPPNCDDGVACTDDSCDEDTDSCVNTPNNGNCDDGLYCNGAETCDATGDCEAGTPPNCDDGVACTDDSCDEDTDSCVNTPNDANCDDGLYCNGAETCDATGDCQAGTPPNCDDGVACTDDSCDEDTDSCVNTPNDANCDDGLYCNGAETCDATGDCQAGTPPNCDDGVACTDDSCDEDTDSCVNTPNDANCDDGLYCNGAETCDATGDCQAGTPPNCDDGVACTDDSCDEDTDSCVNTPNDANCDDGLYCNGAETCDATGDCQAGTPPNCDDGVACTDDSCDEDTDSCVNTPNDANCDDGLYCNGVETCDATGDCQAGTPPDCDDGFDCTDDSCDEDTDMCVNTPNDANCDDGSPCTDDVCIDGVCENTPTTCPDSGNPCTELSCDPNGAQGNCDTESPRGENDPCDDGDPCTTGEACMGGTCSGGTPTDCSSLDDQCNVGVCNGTTGVCEAQPTNENMPCDDGDPCNTGEVCVAGACQGGAAVECPDSGDPCTVLECDATGDEGNCALQTARGEGDPCDDGDACTTGEVCAGGSCAAGTPVECPDSGDPCTILVCDPAGEEGNCDNETPRGDNDPCDDGDPCTTGEVCSGGTCGGGAPVDCSSLDDQCNVGVCNPTTGECAAQPTNEDMPCDDGDPCNTGELCVAGACEGGSAVECPDSGDPCTVIECDAAGDEGNCDLETARGENDPCDDGDACTNGEACSGGICGGGSPTDCSNLDSICRVGVCDPATGGCNAVPDNIGGSCDDGNECTENDQCTPDGECAGSPIEGCGDTPPVPTVGRWGMMIMCLVLVGGLIMRGSRRRLEA